MTCDLVRRSIAVIQAGQAPSGAFVASPSFPAYNYSWLRDGSFIAYGMDRAGAHSEALRFHRWVDATVRPLAFKVERLVVKADAGQPIDPPEWLHCRYTTTGEEGQADWGNFQLDGYGAWLWALCEHIRMTGATHLLVEFSQSIDLILRYLVRFWATPNFDCWEEHGEHLHASTLACLFGGLRAIDQCRGETRFATTCEAIRRYVLTHFVHGGRLTKFADGRSIDANLLWVSVPFGLLAPTDPLMVATVAELDRRCVSGGVHRYPEDTYYGGGQWLILTAWLGWYCLRAGNLGRAWAMLRWVEAQADGEGHLAEQSLDRVNSPGMVGPWLERWGPVAKPLLWSHAMYLVLRMELGL